MGKVKFFKPSQQAAAFRRLLEQGLIIDLKAEKDFKVNIIEKIDGLDDFQKLKLCVAEDDRVKSLKMQKNDSMRSLHSHNSIENKSNLSSLSKKNNLRSEQSIPNLPQKKK